MMQSHHRSSQRRVLLVGRRFWPLNGFDSAAALTRFAIGLSRANLHVEVATARFSSGWPDRFHFQDCLVHRAAFAPKSDWTVSRYTRHLTQWLRAKLDSFDIVLVDSIFEESIAAIEAARGKSCATILMFGGSDAGGELSYWQKNRATKRCAAFGRMADAVMVRHSLDHRHLITHGYDPTRLHRVATPLPTIEHSSTMEQQRLERDAARKSLAIANSDLATMPDTPVVLCNSRMDSDSQIDHFVSRARSLIVANPDFRIWFLGDGPSRDRIHSRLRGDGIRSHIAMPGSFCGLGEIMSAADAYIQPGNGSMRCFLPTAVAYDLPVIAYDHPAVRAIIPQGNNDDVHWFDPSNENSLVKQVRGVFSNLPNAQHSASRLRQTWVREQSEADEIRQTVDLIESLANRQPKRSLRESAGMTS